VGAISLAGQKGPLGELSKLVKRAVAPFGRKRLGQNRVHWVHDFAFPYKKPKVWGGAQRGG